MTAIEVEALTAECPEALAGAIVLGAKQMDPICPPDLTPIRQMLRNWLEEDRGCRFTTDAELVAAFAEELKDESARGRFLEWSEMFCPDALMAEVAFAESVGA